MAILLTIPVILFFIILVIALILGLRLFFLYLDPLAWILSRSALTRRTALGLSRMLGRMHYLMKSKWIPPVFWLVVTTIVVSLFGVLTQYNYNIGAVFHGWTILSLLNLFRDILTQWSTILLVFTLVMLLWLAWRAGKQVVIEEFVDYTSEQPQPLTRGLATLLVARLGQLRDLYQAVDEQRAIPTSVSVNQSIDATINVEDVSQFLKDAVSAQSEFSLGVLKIPVGTLMSLIGRIVQGPRILGSLHRDADLLILTARKYDGKRSRSWRVDRSIPADQSTLQGDDHLTDMVAELACRMFTDLALSASVRWRATATFCDGLRAYRNCLRTPKDRKLNLVEAEKKFIETLAEDQKFDLAYYNLGVVYTELGQLDAAEIAFKNANERDPASWNAFYALALNRYQMAREVVEDAKLKRKHELETAASQNKVVGHEALTIDHDTFSRAESVIELCRRVIDLKPGSANIAKANQLRGMAHELLRELQYWQLCGGLIGLKLTTSTVTKIEELKRVAAIADEELGKLDQNQLDKLAYRSLCNYVIVLKPRPVDVDAVQVMKNLAQDVLDNAKDAIKSRRRAVGQSWKALCAAELQGAGRSVLDNSVIPQLETLASVCLANKAAENRRHEKFRRAQSLLKQALDLHHADADYLALYYFDLGKTYYKWGKTINDQRERKEKFDEAKSEYRHAIRIRPERVEYLASLALTYAELGDKDGALDVCEEVLDYVAWAPREAFEEAFDRMTEVCKQLKLDESSSPILHMQSVKHCLEEEREVIEEEERLKDGELTVYEYEEQLYKGLADHDRDGLEWGYAHFALALGRLSINADKPQKMQEYQGYLEMSKQKLKRKLKAREEDMRKVGIDKHGVEHLEWLCGQFSWALGSLYLELENLTEAQRSLANAVNNAMEEACFLDATQAEKYFRKALQYLKKHHVDEIRSRRIRALLAKALLKQRKRDKYQQALHEVEQALALDSISYVDREVLGDAYFSLNEFDQAIAAWRDALLWRNALLTEPDAPDIYYKIGNANIELGRHCLEPARRRAVYQEAIEYLKQALTLYKSDQQQQRGEACYWLGTLHLELGKYWKAISHFRIAQTLGFAPLTSTFSLGYAYLKNKEYDESERLFQSLSDTVDIKLKKEPLKKVVETEAKEAISLGEFKALAYWGQAFGYAERDVNLKQAEELIEEAEKQIDALKDKDKATKLYYPAKFKHCRGWVHFKRGENIQTAITYLEEALALAAHAEIYLHLALVHESHLQELKEVAQVQSMVTKVRMYCQHVQDLDINGEYVRHVADLLQRLEKKSKEVRKMEAQAHKPQGQTNHVLS